MVWLEAAMFFGVSVRPAAFFYEDFLSGKFLSEVFVSLPRTAIALGLTFALNN